MLPQSLSSLPFPNRTPSCSWNSGPRRQGSLARAGGGSSSRRGAGRAVAGELWQEAHGVKLGSGERLGAWRRRQEAVAQRRRDPRRLLRETGRRHGFRGIHGDGFRRRRDGGVAAAAASAGGVTVARGSMGNEKRRCSDRGILDGFRKIHAGDGTVG
ncbi:hypothetical protein ACP4OV_029056 [Aristida adscensionis]